MLHLLTGVTARDRSEYIRKLTAAGLNGSGSRFFLIVPEQFSFESEKAMLAMAGAQAAEGLTVTTFTRLSRDSSAARRTKRIDPGSRAVIMSMAVDSVKKDLRICRSFASRSTAVSQLLDLADEFSGCGISPDDISACAEKLGGNELLRLKAGEIRLILDTYDSLLPEGYTDGREQMRSLAQEINSSDIFRGATVCFDGFYSFDRSQREVVIAAAAAADETYVTLPGLPDTVNSDIFAVPHEQLRLVMSQAKDAGINCGVSFCKGARTGLSDDMRKLPESLILSSYDCGQTLDGSGVSVFTCDDPQSECEFIGSLVRRLAARDGFRYRDIAVIDTTGEYAGSLKNVFGSLGIGMSVDNARPLSGEPFVLFLRNILRICAEGYDPDRIFSCLKSGLMGMSAEDISTLENYTVIWNISGKKWENDFTLHPAGYGSTFTDPDREELKKINSLRSEIIGKLSAVKHDMSAAADGSGYTRALWKFIEDNRLAKALAAANAGMSGLGIPAGLYGTDAASVIAGRSAAAWDMLVDMLSALDSLTAGKKMSVKRFSELFEIMTGSVRLGQIPQSADSVMVGSPSLIRLEDPACVIVAGVNDGVFPDILISSGLLSGRDRDLLSRSGLAIDTTPDRRELEARFNAFAIMTSPSRRLVMTYPRRSLDGEQLRPSSLIAELRSRLAVYREEDVPDALSADMIWNDDSAFSFAASLASTDSPLRSALWDMLARSGVYPEKFASLEDVSRAGCVVAFRTADKTRSSALFGSEKKSFSPSAVETFYKCPFRFFCDYGLRARARKPQVIDSALNGTIMHYIFEQMNSLWGQYSASELSALGPDFLNDKIGGFLRDFAQEKMGGYDGLSSRMKYLLKNVGAAAAGVITAMIDCMKNSQFHTADVELRLNDDSSVPAYHVMSSDGSEIIVGGQVDRVDIFEDKDNDRNYFRVIDYKTNNKIFDLLDIYDGLNLQMLIYLICIWENGSARYGSVEPAGVLYMPSKGADLIEAREVTDGQIEDRMVDSGRMNGIVLKDEHVIEAMGTDKKGRYIVDRDTDRSRKVRVRAYTPEEMAAIRVVVREKLTDMERQISEGCFDAVPVSGLPNSGYDKVCEFCDYKSVCRHDDLSPHRELHAAVPEGNELPGTGAKGGRDDG